MTRIPDREVVLQARELALGYRARQVLAGVDLEVRAGDVWFFIGPNGSGKTTLLRALLGTLEPLAGRVERHPELARRERIGFVPQKGLLNSSLPTTVREFVSLGLVGTRIRGGARRENLRWALDRVGLGGLERAELGSLSGGQHQRSLLARALVRRPALLVLDEPTAGLDVGTEDAFLTTLSDLNRRDGVTLLFVTHDLEIAARHASHVALFHAGRVATGPKSQMLQPDEVRRVFGWAPQPSAAHSAETRS